MAKDPDIKRRMDRVEEIIDQIDADEVSLDDGRELYDEGHELLREVRDLPDEGSGTVRELD
jgi:exodeoxyribonuclease VII small subunit